MMSLRLQINPQTTSFHLENRPSLAALSKSSQSYTFLSTSRPKSCNIVSSVSSVTATRCVEDVEKVGERVPSVLNPQLMPKHVAVIVDGNRRWAVERNLAPIDGHTAGRKSLKELARLCKIWGIKALTVFLFSTENWTRPKDEVDSLLALLEDLVKLDPEHDIRLSVLGDRSLLSKSFQEVIVQAEEDRKNNSGLQFNIAVNYSGRYDIVKACKGIAGKVKDGAVQPKDIDEKLFEQELETKFTDFPCPDLLIRTSGELRISNFLLWQMAYTELYFVDKLFPDFGEVDFIEALSSFQKRKRRYGGAKY